MTRERIVALIPPTLGAVIFGVAVWVLQHELTAHPLASIEHEIASIPNRVRIVASLLVLASYVLLTGYDALAFRWIRNPLAYPRVALASFVGFVFSHNIGLSFLGGNAVRYRILSSFGVETSEIARVVAFNLITFWVGFVGLGGLVLVAAPVPLPRALHLPFVTSRPIGVVMLAVLAAYVVFSAVRRRPVGVGGFQLPLPRPGWTAAQLVLSSADWALAAAIFWVLLPHARGLSFATVLGVYLLAQVIGLASNVPGGLGVFEGMMVLLLAPYLSGATVFGTAIAYRVLYYLGPLVVAVLVFTGYEVAQRRHWLARGRDLFARWLPEVVPRAFSVMVLVAGIVLLLSGATPAAPGRTPLLRHFVPLPVIELSHFVGSILGVALLLLARALQQRLDAGYFLSLAALALGGIVSMTKGLDYEEATYLGMTFLALLPCHRFFYRRSSLLAESFSADWIVGIALVLVGTLVVTLVAYRNVEYSSDLWWQFETRAHAPRSLRALLGAALALASFALVRLLRPVPPSEPLPSPAELDKLRPLVATEPSSHAWLALLGDKHVLLHEGGAGFVMYGIEGRSWIAMGDPVGPPEVRRELAWRFRELADQHGGRASFYEVTADDLPVYLDLGLVLRKLGEEARVPLPDFSLEGGRRARLRNARNRMLREGCVFEVLPAEAVPPLLDDLEAISDAWLARKNTREKRFSLGCFDREYLTRTPLAVIRRGERIMAFANVWPSGGRAELSVDLMRYGADAPPATMDALFTELMLWGRQAGYQWFSLGMAPLSGFQHHRLAPLWNRLGALLFRYGEHFYNFQGLREFKEKFEPVWEPRYLAASSALAVPIVLTRVAALVNGGVTGTVAR
jgi:phosphatidylglycerol lysyltransferase